MPRASLTRPSRHLLPSLGLAFCSFGGCSDGPSKPPPPAPPGARVVPTVRSTDRGVARVQEHAERKSQANEINKTARDWRFHVPMRPNVEFDASKSYIWTLATEFGPIQIKLRADNAPEHTSNAIYLTLIGFYDGLAIHKIVPGKALETGDPAEDGKGSPGYAFSPEIRDNTHDKAGLVSAISLGDSTDDSKFRITFGPDPTIDPLSTIFGDVENGFDVLKKIEALGTPGGRPSQRVIILKASISIR